MSAEPSGRHGRAARACSASSCELVSRRFCTTGEPGPPLPRRADVGVNGGDGLRPEIDGGDDQKGWWR